MNVREEHVVVLIGSSEGLGRVRRACAQRGVVCHTATDALHAVRRLVVESRPATTSVIATFDPLWNADVRAFASVAAALPGCVRTVGLLQDSAELPNAAAMGLDWYLHEQTHVDRIVDSFMGAVSRDAWSDGNLPHICLGRFSTDVFDDFDSGGLKKESAPEALDERARRLHRRW